MSACGASMSQALIETCDLDPLPGLEWLGDGTHAMGTQIFLLYTHTVPLDAILTETSSSATYIDIDHIDDRPLITGALVREFKVVGDTDGGEAGTRTAVTVDFNPIRFKEL